MIALNADQSIPFTALSSHNSPKDLWIAVNGHVFDLTSFAADHPGGADVLTDCAGTDGSEVYAYAGHSEGAMETLGRYRVGVLEGWECTSTLNTEPADVKSTIKGTGSAIPTLLNVARANSAYLLSGLAVLAVVSCVYALFGALVSAAKGMHGVSMGGFMSPATSFLGGVLLMSGVGCVGMAFVYGVFVETIRHEREVFSYPAVIPRRVG